MGLHHVQGLEVVPVGHSDEVPVVVVLGHGGPGGLVIHVYVHNLWPGVQLTTHVH